MEAKAALQILESVLRHTQTAIRIGIGKSSCFI